MAFRELLMFWKNQSGMKHVFSHFGEMMKIAKNMFVLANQEGSKNELLKMDARLNALQQTIRRDIVTHIAVQGVRDIIPCLAMMSIIKDAERTGDYVKNVQEVYENCPDLSADPLFGFVQEMDKKIVSWFDQAIESFENSDHDLAHRTCNETHNYMKKCDRLVWNLAVDNKGRNAVAIALIIRFYKRIAAHLENICTSVFMPLDKIDYYEKGI